MKGYIRENLRAIRGLWIIFSLFILYGVLIPFQLCVTREAILSNIANITWIPFILHPQQNSS